MLTEDREKYACQNAGALPAGRHNRAQLIHQNCPRANHTGGYPESRNLNHGPPAGSQTARRAVH
jgi:hypothetical protein